MPDPNLWKTAQACIEAHGDEAEAESQRLARQSFSAGHLAEAAALFEVFQAVKHLRAMAGPDRGVAH